MAPPAGRFAVCGAGFIGRNLITALLDAECEVTVVDHHEPPPEFAERTRWIRGEFSSRDVLRKALTGVQVAYHMVSTTVPGDEHVGLFTELAENISATMQFLDVCRETGVERIVFMSSSSVYGLQQSMPIAETAETNPISSHGIHKLTIEKYLLLHQFNHDLDVRIVRLSNPFGPGQNLLGRQGFVAIAIGKLLSDQPILMRGGGSPVRDFVYIDDVSRALLAIGMAPKSPSVLNLGTGIGYSLAHLIMLLEQVTGRTVRKMDGELRKADIPESVLDVSLARDTLGISADVSLRDGLVRTLSHHGISVPGADGEARVPPRDS